MALITQTLEAKDRASLGTSNTRRLRRSGLVPAVLYGKKEPNVNLALGADDLAGVLRHHARIIDVKLPGGKVEKAILKEVQWDAFGEEVLHVDLGRVALTDKIRVKVELKFHGEPKGLAAGGHLEVHVHEVEVECLAGSIPDQIKIDVSHLELDQVMRAREVKVPEGVKLLMGDDTAVAGVKLALLEELPLPGAAPTEAAATEPEVIAKGKKEEEGEGGAEEAPAGGKEKKEKEK